MEKYSNDFKLHKKVPSEIVGKYSRIVPNTVPLTMTSVLVTPLY